MLLKRLLTLPNPVKRKVDKMIEGFEKSFFFEEEEEEEHR